MRVYYYRLTASNVTVGGNRWESDLVDLYDNDVYANYSLTRSNYGQLGADYVWIGLSHASSLNTEDWTNFTQTELDEFTRGELDSPVWDNLPFKTDTGFIRDGRYIDTSARVGIVSYNYDSIVPGELEVYVSDSDDAVYPDEWETAGSFLTSEEIGITGSPRYARFVFVFTEAPDTNAEIYIRVEIDQPVDTSFFMGTQRLLDKFPQWMALHERIPAGDGATPTTIGGKFLNAVAGQWLDGLRGDITYTEFQRFIQTVDLDQMAWAYRTTMAPSFVWSVTGDGLELVQAADWNEFRELSTDDAYFVDSANRTVYVTKDYTVFAINGEVHTQTPEHVWNYVDELGLLVDLERLHLESNENFRHRILDVYINRGGVGDLNLKLALRRELDLWRVYGSTPNSEFAGATPEILEMSDIELDSKYVDPDGTYTDDFEQLVERLSRQYPTTWGRFVWDRALWDVGGPGHAGYGVIPYRYDQDSLPDHMVQSGVGDGDDLFIYRPDVITGPHEFEARLKVRGRQRSVRNEYPPVAINYTVQGVGTLPIYNNPSKTAWFTVEIVTNDTGNPVYLHSFQITSKSDRDAVNATSTPASYGTYRIFSEDGTTTNREIDFVAQTNGVQYGGTGNIPVGNIQSVTLRQGRWVASSYGFIETGDTFEAWFSHDTTEVLRYNTAAESRPSYTGGAPETTPQPFVVMRSLVESAPTNSEWTTPAFEYQVRVNSEPPYTSPQSVDAILPTIPWHPGVTGRSLRLQLRDNIGTGYGAFTVTPTGASLFLPASLLRVDGNATWTTEGQKTLPSTATSITWSTDTNVDYPVEASIWTLFEYNQITPFTGVVDEFGPWRNDEPPPPGNTNYTLRTMNVDRVDFGIPETDDFVITWMGVEVLDDPMVVAWLDSNTIHPAVDEGLDVEYPATAIQETFANGVYSYEPFVVRARLRENPSPEWYPQVHSGFFYDRNEEYYLYARPVTEYATTGQLTLSGLVRQGAPIIVHTDEATPRELRQVAFFDNVATPVLTATALETLSARGAVGQWKLYAAYSDIYNVQATNLRTGQVVATTVSDPNIINIAANANVEDGDEFEVRYRVRDSFYVDNSGEQSVLVFDQPASSMGVTRYVVTYESSPYDPATPVDLPLSPLYSIHNEGFIFISHNEYTLDRVNVSLSPSKIIADGEDYIIITLRSEDQYGNPKPGASFTLSTDFGTLDRTSVTTDHDGFAVVMLTAGATATVNPATITIDGDVDATVTVEVEESTDREGRLYAVPNAEQIRADGASTNLVYGKLEDADFQPVAGATVSWRKARSLYELYGGTPSATGTVTTAVDGSFVIGPFVASSPNESGYWMVSAEATVDGVVVGDVVFWYEYPTALFGIENLNHLPKQPVQMATPIWSIPPYALLNGYPAYYDEATPYAAATPVTIEWRPPRWFALSKYTQYQLRLLESSNTIHKYSKDM